MSGYDTGSRSVLVLFKDWMNGELAQRLLQRRPEYVRVDCVCDALEAYSLLCSQYYDMLLVQTDGEDTPLLRLLESMKAGSPPAPDFIAAAVMRPDAALERRLAQLGADSILELPCSAHSLLACFDYHLGADSARSRSIERLYFLLAESGCSALLNGTRYLACCAYNRVRHPNENTASIYARCAGCFGVSRFSVECGIRAVLDDRWIGKLLPQQAGKHTTNTQIIGLLAERSALWLTTN